MFILVQILGAITLVLSVTTIQQRKKENLLILQIIAMIFFIFQYLLTYRITGAVVFAIGISRGVVFYWYKKQNKKPSVPILILFQGVVVISTIMSWQNIYSIIPLIVTTINTWGTWQDNMKYTRKTSLVAGAGWCIYNLAAQMYTGFMTEFVGMISTIIAIWRLDIREQPEQVEKEDSNACIR